VINVRDGYVVLMGAVNGRRSILDIIGPGGGVVNPETSVSVDSPIVRSLAPD